MTFLLIGRDGNDEDALARRMAAREEHLKSATALREQGKLLHAMAMLDDDGKMTASVMLFELESREELDALLKNEPYVTGKVWQEIEIKPCKLAPGF